MSLNIRRGEIFNDLIYEKDKGFLRYENRNTWYSGLMEARNQR